MSKRDFSFLVIGAVAALGLACVPSPEVAEAPEVAKECKDLEEELGLSPGFARSRGFDMYEPELDPEQRAERCAEILASRAEQFRIVGNLTRLSLIKINIEKAVANIEYLESSTILTKVFEKVGCSVDCRFPGPQEGFVEFSADYPECERDPQCKAAWEILKDARLELEKLESTKFDLEVQQAKFELERELGDEVRAQFEERVLLGVDQEMRKRERERE